MTDSPPAEPLDIRRKRLRFRSWHRGTREHDLILGNFADRYLATFSAEQLDRYEGLLEMSDPDLYNWMMEREPVPAEHDHDVMQLLKTFKLPAPEC